MKITISIIVVAVLVFGFVKINSDKQISLLEDIQSNESELQTKKNDSFEEEGTTFYDKEKNKTSVAVEDNDTETMEIVLFLQDREIARISDCGATTAVTKTIPKTKAVADASLKILFKDELSAFGPYESVKIINGVAEVMLSDENKIAQHNTSCETGHLHSVVKDTLTQYPTISDIKFVTSKGDIMF